MVLPGYAIAVKYGAAPPTAFNTNCTSTAVLVAPPVPRPFFDAAPPVTKGSTIQVAVWQLDALPVGAKGAKA